MTDLKALLEADKADLAAALIEVEKALRSSAAELDAFYRSEYGGDHPYMRGKLAAELATNPARAALARIRAITGDHR